MDAAEWGDYEYIASYVDYVCIVAKDPTSIIDQLQDIQNYKLKGTGPIKHHLGCDYFLDESENLSYAPRTYIKKLITDFITMFGHKPKFYSSPLESNDHPEFDTSEQLDLNDTKKISINDWLPAMGCFVRHTRHKYGSYDNVFVSCLSKERAS